MTAPARATGTQPRPHTKAQSKARPPRVLVTDASRGSAIAVIRSLGRRGWDVIAADDDRSSPGFHSRYASGRLRYPSPAERPDDLAATILRAVERLGIDLVVPVTDDVILPLAAVRDALEARTAVALPRPDALAFAADKIRTMALAERLGIPAPRSVVVTSPREADTVGDELGWPVVVKPARSRSVAAGGGVVRHTVVYAGSAEDLAAQAAVAGGPLLVQEYVPGTGEGVELLLREGVPLAAFQHRRIREVPVTGGASAFRVSVPLDPELLAPSVALLRELRWTGLAMVEFRVGPDGPRLMEVNGRIWGSLPLAVRAGVDFPGMLADLFLGAPLRNLPPIGAYRLGVTSRNLPLEASWIGSVLAARRPYPFLETPPRHAGLSALLRLAAPDGWDVLSLEDPLPGLVEVERLAERAVGRVVRAAGHHASRRLAPRARSA